MPLVGERADADPARRPRRRAPARPRAPRAAGRGAGRASSPRVRAPSAAVQRSSSSSTVIRPAVAWWRSEVDGCSRSASEARRSSGLPCRNASEVTRVSELRFRFPAILGEVGTSTTPRRRCCRRMSRGSRGFAALALLGALQWQRMVADLSPARVVLWVLVAVPPRRGAVGEHAAPLGGDAHDRRDVRLAARGVRRSGCRCSCSSRAGSTSSAPGCRAAPRRSRACSCPTRRADPWPATDAAAARRDAVRSRGLLAFWPRERGRGHLFLSLALLLVLVASPVVSLGGAQPVALGVVLTALTVCFLWLERLPRAPGIGIAAMLALGVAGAAARLRRRRRGAVVRLQRLRGGVRARRAAGVRLGPPLRAVDWPREGAEVLRVDARPGVLEDREPRRVRRRALDSSGPALRRAPTRTTCAEDWRQRPAGARRRA